MADSPGRARSIPARDLDNFFERKGVSPTCESCGNNTFVNVSQFNDDRVASLIGFSLEVDISNSIALPVSIRLCLNCGNSKIYLNAVIEQFFYDESLKAQP